jgi:2-C-methyl-D-erythritol 4-phosphate cytidylyltransferase
MTTAILLAAGKSLRLKSNITPKQFLTIHRKKLYQYALETFMKHPRIQEIILVVNDVYLSQIQDEVKPWAKKKPIHVIAGGKTRQDSSYLGLLYAQLHQKPDYVLIHDVARPLLSSALIDKVILQLKKYPAITLGRHVNDSLFVVNEEASLRHYIDKEDIYLVQTPQAFQFQLIYEAHEHARKLNIKSASDDASLLMLMGKKIHVITGSRDNFKIVTEDDLLFMKSLIKKR